MWGSLRVVAQRAVEDFRPDVVLAGHDMSIACPADLADDLLAVLTFHEARACLASSSVSALLCAEARLHGRYVVRHVPRFHAVAALSTAERDKLQRVGGCRAELIPAGVNVEAFRSAPEQPVPSRSS